MHLIGQHFDTDTLQGKAPLAKTILAKHTRTPGTGPSPWSVKPAQADSRPATTQQASPVTGGHAAPSKDIMSRQGSVQTQHKSGLGQAAVGKRIEVYWDGEKAW